MLSSSYRKQPDSNSRPCLTSFGATIRQTRGRGLSHYGVCVRVYTTARYAHLARDSVKESAWRIAVSIAGDIL